MFYIKLYLPLQNKRTYEWHILESKIMHFFTKGIIETDDSSVSKGFAFISRLEPRMVQSIFDGDSLLRVFLKELEEEVDYFWGLVIKLVVVEAHRVFLHHATLLSFILSIKRE